jgi:hypothetical protein
MSAPSLRSIAARRSLQLLSAMALAACEASEATPPHPADALSFPLGATADPARGLVWVVSGNHDLRYRGGAVLAIDVTTHAFRPELAFELGPFPGPFVLHAPAGTSAPVAGYVASRSDDALTHVRFGVDPAGALTVTCEGGERHEDDGILRCPRSGALRSAPAPDIDGAPLTVGDDPYDLAVLPARSPAHPDLLVSAAMRNGVLATYTLGADGTPSLVGNLALPPTLFGLAADVSGGRLFATWKGLANIQELTVADRTAPPLADARNPWLTAGPVVAVSDFLSQTALSRDRSRAATLSPDGARLYVSYRSPDAMAVLDARPETGNPLREIRKIAIAGDPGELTVLPARGGRPELVAVACFDAARIEFVDPEAGVVVATVRTPRGPAGLAVIDRPELHRMYVPSFYKNTVSVIELDPASPDYLSVVATVGEAP